MFCRSLLIPFALFILAIVLSVLRYTDSDYPFGIFKFFLQLKKKSYPVWFVYSHSIKNDQSERCIRQISCIWSTSTKFVLESFSTVHIRPANIKRCYCENIPPRNICYIVNIVNIPPRKNLLYSKHSPIHSRSSPGYFAM